MLAKQAGAPVKLELSRKDDFIGVHGRWPTTQYYKVGVSKTARCRRSSCAATAAWARTGRIREPLPGSSFITARMSRATVYPVYTNKTVSGNFRGPEFPQGFFGIQSMMDDVAYKLKMDPVDFVLKNMMRKSDECRLHQLHARGVHPPWRGGLRLEEALAARAGLGHGPDQARRGHVLHGVSLRVRPQQRHDSTGFEGQVHGVCRRHRRGRGRQDHDGHDRGGRTRCAALEVSSRLGRHGRCPVFGRRIGQPHHDHDRRRGDRGRARSEARRSRRKACPKARCSHGVGVPNPSLPTGEIRATHSARISSKSRWTWRLGHVRVLKVSSRCTIAGG